MPQVVLIVKQGNPRSDQKTNKQKRADCYLRVQASLYFCSLLTFFDIFFGSFSFNGSTQSIFSYFHRIFHRKLFVQSLRRPEEARNRLLHVSIVSERLLRKEKKYSNDSVDRKVFHTSRQRSNRQIGNTTNEFLFLLLFRVAPKSHHHCCRYSPHFFRSK